MACTNGWPRKMRKTIPKSEIQAFFDENSQPVEKNHQDSESQVFDSQITEVIDPIDSLRQQEQSTIIGLDSPKLSIELMAKSEEISDDEDEVEPAGVAEKTIFTRHRKKNRDYIVSVPTQTNKNSVFMNTFPDSSSLLRKGLSYTLDTAIIESFIYFLRRTFLNKNVLILSPFNISRLSAFQDGTASQNDVSREIQTWWEVAINEMNSISDGKFLDIPTIAGVMFSNPDMAQEKTLKIPLTPNEAMGHFVFFHVRLKIRNCTNFRYYERQFCKQSLLFSSSMQTFFRLSYSIKNIQFHNWAASDKNCQRYGVLID